MPVALLILVLALVLTAPAWGRTRATSKKEVPTESAEDKARRLRPGWAATVASGVPHPIDIGLGYLQPKGNSHIGSFGLFQKSTAPGRGVRDIKIQMRHLEYRYRSEPLERHPIFWQLAAGYQELQVDGTRTVNISQNELTFTTDLHGTLHVRSLYWTPKVGMIKHLTNGMTLSWGFGYMIPALVTSDFKSSVPGDPLVDELLQQVGSYKLTEHELERVGKRVGQVGLPQIDIIELSWRL